MDAPISELPLFGRAGAALPLWPVASHVDAADRSTLELEVIGHEGPPEAAVRELYEDDGASRAYRRGAFARTRLAHGLVAAGAVCGAAAGGAPTYWVELGPARGTFQSPRRRALVRVHLPASLAGREVVEVVVDGRPVPAAPASLAAAVPGLAAERLREDAPPADALAGEGPWQASGGGALVVVAFPNAGRAATVEVRF